jgi:hypothetical protein
MKPLNNGNVKECENMISSIGTKFLRKQYL